MLLFFKMDKVELRSFNVYVFKEKQMRITKYIHSCLLIENESDKILFDPGLFSFVEGKVSRRNLLIYRR